MAFLFRFDDFRIYNTRSLHNDSDLVTFLVRVGNETFPPAMRWMGDVNNGDHHVGLTIGPITVDPATPVVTAYSILNTGGSAVEWEARIKFVLNAFADAGGQNVPFGLGSLINDFLMFPFHAFEFADCDGIVVTDAISLTGSTLTLRTQNGQTYSEVRRYPQP
jgi:hypothetical protein